MRMDAPLPILAWIKSNGDLPLSRMRERGQG